MYKCFFIQCRSVVSNLEHIQIFFSTPFCDFSNEACNIVYRLPVTVAMHFIPQVKLLKIKSFRLPPAR